MKNWVKRMISSLVAALIFAIGYPGARQPGGGIDRLAITVVLGVALLPAAMVWVGTSRLRWLEVLGWLLQAAVVVSIFAH